VRRTNTTDDSTPSPILDRIALTVFLLGLAALVFLAGIVVGRYRLPPSGTLNAAKDAAMALKDKYLVPDEPFAFARPRRQGGVVVHDRARAFAGPTLFTGYHEGRFGGFLVDMAGEVLHRWDAAFGDVWPDGAPHVRDRAPDRLVNWHGVHLFPDGDLLLNFQGGNFPLGGGLVRLDRDSRVKWRLARNTHHDMAVLPNGTILVAAHEYHGEGVPECARQLEPPYYEDLILEVLPDGAVRKEISILRALCRSPYKGLFSAIGTESGTWRGRIPSNDPLHLNNVDLVTPEQASTLSMARAGDLLLSLRNLNTVGFLDRGTGAFRWLLTGPFIRQHDPDLLPNGNLLIFDNRGGGEGTEHSQVLEIDPRTQAIRWSFGGLMDDPLWSEKAGNQQPLPNGNVLVTESWGGRILEVTRGPEPAVVWEYVNLLPPGEDGRRRVGLISQAVRFGPDELRFLNRQKDPTSFDDAGPSPSHQAG
jgi:Arylsulfotransferase (ASST)